MQTPSLSLDGQHDAALSAPHTATEAELGEAWFEAAPPSTRRPSAPPPVSAVGEFLGDPLADAWLR